MTWQEKAYEQADEPLRSSVQRALLPRPQRNVGQAVAKRKTSQDRRYINQNQKTLKTLLKDQYDFLKLIADIHGWRLNRVIDYRKSVMLMHYIELKLNIELRKLDITCK